MTQEVELKLSIPEEHAAGIWQVLARYPHDKPVTRRLFSVYYDTPDSRLRTNGVALRLRREGRRWIQAVKREGSVEAGLHRRAEHEIEVPAQLVNFTALIEAGIGDLIATRSARDAIRVAFATEFSRTSALLQFDSGNTVEICLDRGAVVSGQRREPICEIELELKSGTAKCLFDLALEITQRLPVRLENRSKAQRGYALAANARPTPVKAASSRLTTGMTVDEAFVAIAFDCLAHLQANEHGVLAGRDPEYLHQARVALRRLRSVLRIFEPAVPKTGFGATLEELKSLVRVLGTARNWDVFATETLAQAAKGVAAHPGVAALKRRVQSKRRRAGQAARAVVCAAEYTSLLIRLACALDAREWVRNVAQRAEAALPLSKFAANVLTGQHARVMKRGRRLGQLAFEDLHRLRIEIKRLRYAAEFFLPLAPKKARAYLDALTQLQDLLGRINDHAGAWRLLDSLAIDAPATEVQQAVGYVRGWSACEAEQCQGRLADSWARFERARKWW